MADRTRGPADPVPADSTVSPEDRTRIARIAEEIVPALSATLAADGLAEVELRRPGWRVRVRRATTAGERTSPSNVAGGRRRSGERTERAERDRGLHADRDVHHDRSNGSGPATHPARAAAHDADPPEEGLRVVVRSPSVGPFRPGRELRRGVRVREGDRLGSVDLLGVAQEVVSPVDGSVTAILVEADEAVEYGQPLVELERASAGIVGTTGSTGGGGAPGGPGEG